MIVLLLHYLMCSTSFFVCDRVMANLIGITYTQRSLFLLFLKVTVNLIVAKLTSQQKTEPRVIKTPSNLPAIPNFCNKTYCQVLRSI